MKKNYKFLLSAFYFLFFLNTANAQDYYWTGGSGNWSDVTHWATTSGGTTFHATPPTASNNVIFDDNSGLVVPGGSTITIDVAATCNDMRWEGTPKTVRLTKTQPLAISGSLTLLSGMLVEGTGLITFNTSNPAATITTDNVPIVGGITFDGSGGWQLQDSLKLYGNIIFTNGELDFNGQYASCYNFTSTAANGQQLKMANSTIDILTSWNSSGGAPLLPVQSAGSVIRITTGSFTGKNGDTYNVLETTGNGTVAFGAFTKIIAKSSTLQFNTVVGAEINADTLLFASGSFFNRIFAGSSINVDKYLGKTESKQTMLYSTSATVPATINMNSTATVKMDTVILSQIIITGNPDYPTTGSIDANSSNTGWQFNNPMPFSATDYYWTGAADNFLTNVSNWELGYPGSGIATTIIFTAVDNIYFLPGVPIPNPISINSNVNFNNLHLYTGSAVNFANNGTVNAAGNIIQHNGTLNFTQATNTLNVAGDLVVNGICTVPTITAKNIKVMDNSTLTLRPTTTVLDSTIVGIGSTFTLPHTHNFRTKELIVNGRLNDLTSGAPMVSNFRVDSNFVIGPQGMGTISSATTTTIGKDLFVGINASLTANSREFTLGSTNTGGNMYLKGTFTTQPGQQNFFTVYKNINITDGGSLNILPVSGSSAHALTITLHGNLFVGAGGRINVQRNSGNQPQPRITIGGICRIDGDAYFYGIGSEAVRIYFKDSLVVTGSAQFNNIGTYLESSKQDYALRLGTPTTTTFTEGNLYFNAPATTFNLYEDLIIPTTNIYITNANRSIYSNGNSMKCNILQITNASVVGRMLDFSGSLLEVRNFTANITRANECKFDNTTLSFWSTGNHTFNANIAASPLPNISRIGKVTFTEVAPQMIFQTSASGVTIDTLITGDKSIFFNYTNTTANYAITANVWNIVNPCNMYAMNSPIMRVGEIIGPPTPTNLCLEGVSQLHSMGGMINLTRTTTADSIPLRNIYCRNVNFGGTGTPSAFVSPENYDLGGNTGSIIWTLPPDLMPSGQDFYWIGNDGSWFNENNWSFDVVPPKAPAGCIPTLFDNVIFDACSFTDANQRVRIDTMPASITHITWKDPGNPAIKGGIQIDQDLEILGSVDFTGCSYAATAIGTRVVFISKNEDTITTGGLVLYLDIVNFTHTGTYTFRDDFILSQREAATSGIYHYSGNLVSMGNNITTSRLNSTSLNNAPRSVNFAGSTIKAIFDNTENYYYSAAGRASSWTLDLRNLTSCDLSDTKIIAHNIITNGTAGQSVVYHDVEVQYQINQTAGLVVRYNDIYAMGKGPSISVTNQGNFTQGFTARKVFLAVNDVHTNIYTFNTSSRIYNITDSLLVLSSPSLCNSDTARITIRGSASATPSVISVGDTTTSFEITRVIVANINNVGDTMRINDGVNGGSILGNIEILERLPHPGRDFYWVPNTHVEPSNTGSGFWNDPSHWSIDFSGGNPEVTNPNGCIPSQYDNVIFDAYSFTANSRIVTLNIHGAACKNMTWTADAGAMRPSFGYQLGGTFYNLQVYGSLSLAAGMTRFQPRALYMQSAGADTVRFNGLAATAGSMPNEIYFSGGGNYEIWDSYPNNIAIDIVYVNDSSSLHVSAAVRFPNLIINPNSSFYINNNVAVAGYMQVATTSTAPRTINLSGATLQAGYFNWNLDDFTTVDISNANVIGTSTTTSSFTFAENTIWNPANSNITAAGSITLNNATIADFPFHNIILTGTSEITATLSGTGSFNFNKVQFTGFTTFIGGTAQYTFDTLMYARSSTNRIQDGKILNINDKFIASGSPCGLTRLLAHSSVLPAIINLVNCYPVSIAYGKITNITGTGCDASYFVVYEDPIEPSSNAVNWTIYEINATSSNSFLGSDTTLTCIDLPYIQTSEMFGIADFYTWFYKPTISSWWEVLPQTGATLNITRTGYYALRADYGLGCHLGDTISTTFRRHFILDTIPPPAVITTNSTTNTITCLIPDITLIANELTDPLDTLNYAWTDTIGNSWATQSIIVSVGGVYTVTVTGANGCVNSDQVTIHENNLEKLIDCLLMDDKLIDEICLNGYYEVPDNSWDIIPVPCVDISAYAYRVTILGTDYIGQSLAGFQFPLGATTVMWTAEGENAGGIFVYDTCTFTVTIIGYPEVIANFEADTVCFGSATSFTNLSTIGGVPSTIVNTEKWYWYLNGSTVPFDSVREPARSLSAGSHTVKLQVISTDSCIDEKTISVLVRPLPAIASINGETGLCINTEETYSFVPQAGIVIDHYVWKVTGGAITGGGGTSHNYVTVNWTTSGNHEVRLLVSNSYCSAPDTGRLTVNVMPRANQGNIDIDNRTICLGENVTLSPSSALLDSTFRWYASQTATTPLYTGNALALTAVMRDTTFYVAVSGTGICENDTNMRKPVTVKVNPTVNDIRNFTDTICSGAAFSITPTTGDGAPASGVTYSWTVSPAASITGVTGQSAQSNQASIGQTLTNHTSVTVDVIYTVTPTWTSGIHVCSGNPFTVTISVTPRALPDDINYTYEEYCSGDEVFLSVSSTTVPDPVFRWYASQTSTMELHVGQHYLVGILTSDTVFYVSVTGTGFCENDIGNRKEILVPIVICKLLDCDALTDKEAEEDYYKAGYYTHIGTAWDAIPAMPVDSMEYYFYDEETETLISGGVNATLDGARFPVGISTVVVVAYYGDEEDACVFTVMVTKACPDSIPDDEGNMYNVTKLAGLCWTENLKATKYAVNLCEEPIPVAKPYYSTLHPGANTDIFGLLYDWYSAVGNVETECPTSVPNQGICPEGWRIPTRAEWNKMTLFSAQSLKSENYWFDPGTNDYGFDARPAGWYNGATQRFEELYGFAGWWASDDDVTGNQFANYFYLTYYCNIIREATIAKGMGLSVRCVMD